MGLAESEGTLASGAPWQGDIAPRAPRVSCDPGERPRAKLNILTQPHLALLSL